MLKATGRKSVLHGIKHGAGFVIRPDQMLQLLHDTRPNLPIPRDAQFKGIGIKDEGSNSLIQFYYLSACNPLDHCLELSPHSFLRILVELADGLLPRDSELDGIEVSDKFTVLLLRVKSDHFPPHPGNQLPMFHLRYEWGQILLVDPSQAIASEKRITIKSDDWMIGQND